MHFNPIFCFPIFSIFADDPCWSWREHFVKRVLIPFAAEADIAAACSAWAVSPCSTVQSWSCCLGEAVIWDLPPGRMLLLLGYTTSSFCMERLLLARACDCTFLATKTSDLCFWCFKLILILLQTCTKLHCVSVLTLSLLCGVVTFLGSPGLRRSCLPATKDQSRVSVVDSSWLVFWARLYLITFQIYPYSDFLFRGEE